MLWLWWRLAAVALIGPLAWESPYTESVALKIKKEVGGEGKEEEGEEEDDEEEGEKEKKKKNPLEYVMCSLSCSFL